VVQLKKAQNGSLSAIDALALKLAGTKDIGLLFKLAPILIHHIKTTGPPQQYANTIGASGKTTLMLILACVNGLGHAIRLISSFTHLPAYQQSLGRRFFPMLINDAVCPPVLSWCIYLHDKIISYLYDPMDCSTEIEPIGALDAADELRQTLRHVGSLISASLELISILLHDFSSVLKMLESGELVKFVARMWYQDCIHGHTRVAMTCLPFLSILHAAGDDEHIRLYHAEALLQELNSLPRIDEVCISSILHNSPSTVRRLGYLRAPLAIVGHLKLSSANLIPAITYTLAKLRRPYVASSEALEIDDTISCALSISDILGRRMLESRRHVVDALKGDCIFSILKLSLRFGTLDLTPEQRRSQADIPKKLGFLQKRLVACMEIIARYTVYYSVLKRVMRAMKRVDDSGLLKEQSLPEEMAHVYSLLKVSVESYISMKRKYEVESPRMCMSQRVSSLSTLYVVLGAKLIP
jgi:hypothetical protein